MAENAPRGGLFVSLRGLVATGVATVKTRLELLATELQEEKARLIGLLVYGAVATVFLSVGLIFLAVFMTVLLWDSHRLLVLGMFTMLFLVGGTAALIVARRHANTPSGLFSASLAELARDQEAATGNAGGYAAGDPAGSRQ